MDNKSAMAFFEKMSNTAKDNPFCVKMKGKDLTDYDADFILQYTKANDEILDLGTGTGLIVNKIYDKVRAIDCIEPFDGLSRHIVKSSNIRVFSSNIFNFKTSKKYDLITIFGTMHYFNTEEAVLVYKKYFNYLKDNGRIIIKNQFGVERDVIVQGFSEEQNTDYYAHYRHLDREIEILKDIGFKNTEKFDIYPKEANRWENTHFWAITGEK